MAKTTNDASKPVYSVAETITEVAKLNKKTSGKSTMSDKEYQQWLKDHGLTVNSSTETAASKAEMDKYVSSVQDRMDNNKWDKKHTYYEDGYYWVKHKDGKVEKLNRWSLDNSKGTNLSYASDTKYRDMVTTTFGTYDKKYNPSGVKESQAKLTGKNTKLGNTDVVKVKVNSKYQLIILDSTSKYSKKDIQAAADTSSSKVKNILLKDSDIKANINTNMNLNKLTKKQITDLVKGKITPTLSIKDDGKTVVVTDAGGKKYTIKFKVPVSEVGSVYGIGDLRDLYTKGFTAKQIARLMKAADKTYTDKEYNKALKQLTDDLEAQLERNAAITGDRVNATTKLSQVSGPTKWNPLRTSIDEDESFGIWEEKGDKTTNSASADDVPTVDNPTSGTDAASIATYSSDGMLNISPANMGAATYGGKPVNTDTKQEKGTISRRLLRSDPLPFNGKSINKPDTPWYEARGDIGSLYESGAGKTRETLMHSLGIWEGSPLTYLRLSATRYNRFKLPTPDSVLQKSFAHVFFVRPQCNVKMSASQNKMDEASNDNSSFANNPNYMYAASNAPQIVHELSYDCMNQSSDFSFILSNAAISFSLNDEYINTDTYGTGYTGYKVSYGKHGVESRTAGDFTVSFQDDRNMDVYHMIKLWCDYIDGCYTGTYHPKADTILNHILDYTGAVYYILTAEDGETILFWSKYYGVYPSTIPSNQYSWSAGTLLSHITLDVKFNYS